MPDARVVTIAVATESDPVTTHFQLQFSTDGSSWTPYHTSSTSPSSPEDLTVALLSSGVYTLDGVNAPAGNQEAASREGNWYRLRLKSAGGYGNWSAGFKAAAEPDDDGPLSDVAQLRLDFASARIALDFETEAEADAFLGTALTDAMDELRDQEAIDDLYTGTRTNAQGRLLARGERFLALALLLERAATMKATGTHAPLLVEDSESVWSLADRYRERAAGVLARLSSETTATPFALPAAGSTTFTRLSAARDPLERLDLLDEARDNLAAADLGE